MNQVYHWIGQIIFWAVAVIVLYFTAYWLKDLFFWLKRNVWFRTYIFQWYEYKKLKAKAKGNVSQEVLAALKAELTLRKRFRSNIYLAKFWEIVYEVDTRIKNKKLVHDLGVFHRSYFAFNPLLQTY